MTPPARPAPAAAVVPADGPDRTAGLDAAAARRGAARGAADTGHSAGIYGHEPPAPRLHRTGRAPRPAPHMEDWAAHIPTLAAAAAAGAAPRELDLAGLAEPFGAGYATAVYGTPIADLDAGVRAATPVARVRDATGVRSMRAAIGALPGPGESVHLWIGGQHSMGHVVPAVLELAAPAVIDALHVSTLTFSRDNAAEWAALMDAGRVRALTVLCSQYFEKTSAGIFDYAAGLLRPRGARIVPRRCHAKILCAALSDGRTVTAEGSANTRSARTLEQVTLFGNPAVHAFHVAQIGRAEQAGNRDRGLAGG